MVETDGRVLVELPAEKEFARLLRLLVSGIASRMNFNLDAVDDLKIAVEEAFLMAMRRRVAGPLSVVFRMDGGSLQIDFTARLEVGAGPDRPDEDFGSFILEAVVDELQDSGSDERFELTLVKKP